MGAVHRYQPDGSWQGVPTRPYGTAGRRHELIGPADGAPHYRVRYFEIAPATGRRSSATSTTTAS
jgi:hypothetical protein